MSDTIYYSLRLKDYKTPRHAIERIQKKVRPKGVTANWTVEVKEQSVAVFFGDGESEPLTLCFRKKEASGSCRVAFPTEGALFENDKKSEWKALIQLLHSLKPFCAEIGVEDDRKLAGAYFKSLDYKFDIRALTPQETERLDRLYQQGFTDHEAFLFQIFAEDTGRDSLPDWKAVIHPYTKLSDPFPQIGQFWETYIFETSTLKGECLRAIYKNDVYAIHGKKVISGDPPAEIYTFALGVGAMFSCYDFIDNTWGKGKNVTLYYKDIFLPLFQAADAYGRCRFAYQLFVSIYDYCKFQFVGKDEITRMIEAYVASANV